MQRIITTLNLIDWREVFLIFGKGLAVLAVLTYWAGWGVGRAVHDASGWLARSPQALPQAAPVPTVTVDRAPQPDALTARIAALRAQGWSQQRIADAVGVSRSTVRRRLAMA